MSVALVRRNECVPYELGFSPMPLIHSETSRAYCRVVVHRPLPPRPAKRNSLAFFPAALRSRRPPLGFAPSSRSGQACRSSSDVLSHGAATPLRRNILDHEADDIATSELAVDREIEHGKVALSSLGVQFGADRPDVLRAERRLRTDQLALVPRVPVPSSRGNV